jgi:hypothetical protein
VFGPIDHNKDIPKERQILRIKRLKKEISSNNITLIQFIKYI